MRISTYFGWGRVIICFISIFICTICEIIWFISYLYVLSARHCRTDFACLSSWYFISHFTFCIAQQCFFHSLFHKGEIDYLCDNLIHNPFSKWKVKYIFFFLSFFEERIATRFFLARFNIWKTNKDLPWTLEASKLSKSRSSISRGAIVWRSL